MNKKILVSVLIGLGITAIFVGGAGVFAEYYESTTGQSLSVATGMGGEALISAPVEAESEKPGDIHGIIFFKTKTGSFAQSTQPLAVAQSEVQALASGLEPLGIEPEYEGTDNLAIFGAYSAKIPNDAVSKLKNRSEVKAVVNNEYIHVPVPFGDVETSESSYITPDKASEYHNINQLPSADGINIAVIDSGAPKKEWVKKAITTRDGTPYDQYGHGAAVSQVIHDISPNAGIVSIKTLSETGSSRTSTILSALQKAATMDDPEIDIMNLSLGSAEPGFSPLSEACEILEKHYSVEIVSAAGNTGSYMTSPATGEGILSVGAIDPSTGELTEYSARGSDINAVGNVRTVWLGAERNLKGTSFACPITVSALARYMKLYEVTPSDFDDVSTIRDTAFFQESGEEKLGILDGELLSQNEPVEEPSTVENSMHWILAILSGAIALSIAFYWEKY